MRSALTSGAWRLVAGYTATHPNRQRSPPSRWSRSRGPRVSLVTITGNLAETRTIYFSNTNIKCQHYVNLISNIELCGVRWSVRIRLETRKASGCQELHGRFEASSSWIRANEVSAQFPRSRAEQDISDDNILKYGYHGSQLLKAPLKEELYCRSEQSDTFLTSCLPFKQIMWNNTVTFRPTAK